VLAVVLAALVVFVPATSAMAGERARLTWDTDATDIDLHVWDEDGNHAWYGSQEGIADAELSTDIVYGYGPEQFEEFEYDEGRDLTFGVCYFGSNRGDGVVPETVATLEITDPGGGRRVLKRRLRADDEAFHLGASPQEAPAYQPGDDWCGELEDGDAYHPVEEDGGVGDPGDGGASADADADGTGGSPSFAGCDRTRRRLGVVEVCGDTISGDGPQYTMRGNVRVNGGVNLGDAVTLDTETKRIRSEGVTSVSVDRGSAIVPVVAGPIEINAAGTTDPISGRSRLAALEVTSPQMQGLRVGGLEVRFDAASGPVNLFVDDREGGGIVGAASLSLPFAGSPVSAEALALGVHADSRAPVRALGGKAKFGEVALPGGWRFGELELSYSEGNDTWSVKGGLQMPSFGVDVDGSIARGELDSLGIAVSRDVPLGTTGFILSKLGGRVEGLARPPLRMSAIASGRWGSVPGLDAGLILLEDVTLTIDLSGRASLKGKVGFVRSGGPVSGTLDIGFAIDPFEAEGRLAAEAKVVGLLELESGAGIRMNSQHFTAAGNASGKVRGINLGNGRSVFSDKGLGASGEICRLGLCVTVGAIMKWDRLPSVEWVGSDLDEVVTVSRRRRKADFSIDVPRNRPLLFVDGLTAPGTGAAEFTIRAPGGRRYTSRRGGRGVVVSTDPATGMTAMTVFRPRPGRWSISKSKGTPAAFTTQTIRRVERLRVKRVAPSGSRRSPLKRTKRKVSVSWTSSGLPRGTRVDVYAARDKGALGTLVAEGRKARGRVRIATSAFPAGRSYLHLVVRRAGQPIDDVQVRKPVFVR